ncbi:MAG: glycerate kinase [Candidatus Harrisonbacteria bacterium CG10_big_fil_rev_8_21_14_0_10_44_23]|uniref:Glycerate kinase n=1 Tax=Candidatus Harrisonbacteria bacterium CG10_big_fil_rev_8_21_14_0_10_44_23 TaxID=1974585 RepID=A0A2H0UQK1_9BACT|nr:MAG: glycerate kinase [Candidatus Harrisonbacteria bacterium CG10_big_fil_rev_8_21_14_0_10_44_23]
MRKIKNQRALATSPIRKDALRILEAGLEAIDTEKAIKKNIKITKKELIVKHQSYSLENVENIYLVGVGKCVIDAAQVLEKKLKRRLKGGIVYGTNKNEIKKYKKLKLLTGNHPTPKEENVQNSQEILDFLKNTTEKDLVLFLISGGGSSLLCLPIDKDCTTEQRVFNELTEKGAIIEELNTVRKHISKARGGRLAEAAYPSRVISIVFSDVPGDDLGFISSGPTYKDKTTVEDAKKVLEKYSVTGVDQLLMETPKDDKYFDNAAHILFISNKDALAAMKTEAQRLGYNTEIKSTTLKGEAREIGARIGRALDILTESTCFLYGGETTVKIGGRGRGGRNQEVSLGALSEMQEPELVVSFASDGLDNTDAAGALADFQSLNLAKEKNLNIRDYLEKNDSYDFFKALDDQLITGPTGSNVSDLIIALKKC